MQRETLSVDTTRGVSTCSIDKGVKAGRSITNEHAAPLLAPPRFLTAHQMGDDDWEYSSNGVMVCTRLPPPLGNGENQCSPPPGGVPQKDVSVLVKASDLPGGAGANTYFVGVGMRPGQRAEDQEYALRVRTAAVAIAVVVVVVFVVKIRRRRMFPFSLLW